MFYQSIAITIFYFQLNLWFVEGKKGEGYRETEQSKTILKKAADILKCKPSELNKLKYIGAELKENRDMLIFHLRLLSPYFVNCTVTTCITMHTN